MSKKEEIARLTREIEAVCSDLSLVRRIRIGNLCRRTRLAAGRYEDFDVEPGKTGEDVSQKQMILEYLQLGQPITSLEALRYFGCFRLSARIADLRKDGYVIDKITIHNKETGKTYAEYLLKDGRDMETNPRI